MNRSHLEPAVVIALLALHALLLGWGIARNSVTYDENTHLASGMAAVTRGNLWVSAVNPPLVKAACALAALTAGAVPPSDSAIANFHDPWIAAESFMRANAAHYHARFTAARAVIAALSIALGLLVWFVARRRSGPLAGGVALALYALCPEILAHGSLVTLDLATALGLFASLIAFLRFTRTGAWRDGAMMAVAVAATVLTRFTGLMLLPLFAMLAAAAIAMRVCPRPGRLALGVALLVPVMLAALQLGYRGETSWRPLAAGKFSSQRFQALQRQFPGLALPLPDAYVAELDHQAYESQPGITPSYLLGQTSTHSVWYYTPIALAVKWPLALWGAIALAAVFWLRDRGRRANEDAADARARFSRAYEALALMSIPVALLASSMFLVQLNVGVRYLLPALPPLFVLASGWLVVPGRARRVAAVALVLVAAIEVAGTAPWYLSFFNAAAGGPGNGDRIVNDSNIDVGQGLIALREDLARLGIRRVHLSYHGTADPALYGIDAVPYVGGTPGTESDWIAVSSYYFVGLSQRMMTARGRTPFVQIDFTPLWARSPAARPARCMYLFRLR